VFFVRGEVDGVDANRDGNLSFEVYESVLARREWRSRPISWSWSSA